MAVYSPALAIPPLVESQAQLRHQLGMLADFWNTCAELELTKRPEPGRWCRKEILGHLIDSALNNHHRIVGTSLAAPSHQLRPYDQDAWIRVADYRSYPSAELLTLWTSLNNLILRLINRLPPHLLEHEYLTLNSNPTTLHWLISGYALHPEHHVWQIIHGD